MGVWDLLKLNVPLLLVNIAEPSAPQLIVQFLEHSGLPSINLVGFFVIYSSYPLNSSLHGC